MSRAMVLLLWVLGGPVLGQDAAKGPFVEYPERLARYLERIHNRHEGQANSAALAFRPNTPGGFPAWQREARQGLVALLGLEQIRRDAGPHRPVVKLEAPHREEGYTRRLGRIETEPGVTLPFWLLTPDGESSSTRPLAICAHGHDADGWNTYAGVYRDQDHREKTLGKDGDVGVQAVKRGFVTLVPATRGLAAAVAIPDPKGRHGNRPCRAQLVHCLLAGRTPIGERVWDIQRLLDWALKALPGIDRKKVLLTGNSGGGVLTVYVAALDERVSVAVPSCSFTSFTSATGYVFHCDCCLVPRAQVLLGDLADIGALTAPRSLLAVHGRQDGLHFFADVETAMARVAEIYAAADAAGHFQHRWGAAGHKFYPELMWPFVDAAIAGKSVPRTLPVSN